MPIEIICAIIAATGTLISAWIAFFVSRSTANKEIIKMKLTWEREDLVSSDDEFAEMSAAAARYISYDSFENKTEAMCKIAAIRSKETGNVCNNLDALYSAIQRDDPIKADVLLTQVINDKRGAKSKSNT